MICQYSQTAAYNKPLYEIPTADTKNGHFSLINRAEIIPIVTDIIFASLKTNSKYPDIGRLNCRLFLLGRRL